MASDYTNRHNKVTGYIHWTICKYMGLQVHKEYYGHTPESDINVTSSSVMWDVPVTTDQTILAN